MLALRQRRRRPSAHRRALRAGPAISSNPAIYQLASMLFLRCIIHGGPGRGAITERVKSVGQPFAALTWIHRAVLTLTRPCDLLPATTARVIARQQPKSPCNTQQRRRFGTRFPSWSPCDGDRRTLFQGASCAFLARAPRDDKQPSALATRSSNALFSSAAYRWPAVI